MKTKWKFKMMRNSNTKKNKEREKRKGGKGGNFFPTSYKNYKTIILIYKFLQNLGKKFPPFPLF